MQKFDLFLQRQVLLFLDCQDKIKIIAYLSKKWNALVFSGYAWESLFNPQYDAKWIPFHITKEGFRMFKHFKGIKDLYIYSKRFCLAHLSQHISQFENLFTDTPYSIWNWSLLEQLELYRDLQVFKKIRNDKLQISRLHMASYWSNLSQIQQILDSSSCEERVIFCQLHPFSQEKKLNALNVDYQKPIHYAARNGTVETIKLLQKYGADIHSKQQMQLSVFYYAVSQNTDIEVLKFFIANGASLYFDEKQGNRTALHIAAQSNSSLDVLKFFLQYIQDINCLDMGQSTPLHYAVQNKNLEIMKFLIENGAKINAINTGNGLPLH